jgi:hypothetical protein
MLKIVKVANKLARKYAQRFSGGSLVDVSGPKMEAIKQISTSLNTLVTQNLNNSQLKEFKALFDHALAKNTLDIDSALSYYKILLSTVPGIHDELYRPLSYLHKYCPTSSPVTIA